MHPTHLFCPVVLVDGVEIANSKITICCDCAKWIHYAGTVSHYKDHARRHEDYTQRCRGLSDPDGPAVHFVSFIFQTGAPARAIETLRRGWPGEDLPNRQKRFSLLWRGSRDGFAAQEFRRLAIVSKPERPLTRKVPHSRRNSTKLRTASSSPSARISAVRRRADSST
jgi:hypothetical protein